MNFLGMGPMELMLILVLALIVFGPGKLPEVAGQVGKAVRDMRRATTELSGEFNRAISLEVEEKKRQETAAEPAPPPPAVAPPEPAPVASVVSTSPATVASVPEQASGGSTTAAAVEPPAVAASSPPTPVPEADAAGRWEEPWKPGAHAPSDASVVSESQVTIPEVTEPPVVAPAISERPAVPAAAPEAAPAGTPVVASATKETDVAKAADADKRSASRKADELAPPY